MKDSYIFPKEAIFPIEHSLEFDCCSFTLGSSAYTNNIPLEKFTTMDGTQVWALLAKQ